MNSLIRFTAIALMSGGMISAASAQSKQQIQPPVQPQIQYNAPQAMSPEQMKTAKQMQQVMQQQQASFEQFISAQKTAAEADKARFEAFMKLQREAADKHQQAMIQHMESLRKQMDQVAAQTRKVVEAQAEAQQRRIYGYMLGQMPEGEMKDAFKKAEARRIEMRAEMKQKHAEMEKKIQAARLAHQAKIAEMRKKAG